MTNSAILYPVFAQVFLAFIMVFWMGWERVKVVRQGKVKASDIAMRKADLPDRSALVSNQYHNQFEMPMLFYALVAFVIITNKVDIYMVGLAWAYVGIRYIHAYIHTLVRSIMKRFYVFIISTLILLAMWVLFAIRIVLVG